MADLNERICIIGAGPAGISAAMYLEKKGYTNYEIYEKLNKIGGKSWSPKIEVNGEERTYETGAIMGAKTYFLILMEFLLLINLICSLNLNLIF